MGHHGNIRLHDVSRRQQPGMHRHRLEVPPETLPRRDHRRQPSGLAEPSDARRERSRQRATVGHHVGHPQGCTPWVGPDPGQHRRQARVQVGGDNRHTVQGVCVPQHLVVRALLIIHTEHHRLQRGIASLDEVSRLGHPRRQRLGQSHDQREATRAQTPLVCRGVQQDAITHRRLTYQVGIGQRRDGALVREFNLESHSPGPRFAQC